MLLREGHILSFSLPPRLSPVQFQLDLVGGLRVVAINLERVRARTTTGDKGLEMLEISFSSLREARGELYSRHWPQP